MFFEIAERVLEIAYTSFPEGQRPARSLVNPGRTAPWDECCAGQLWTAVQGVQPIYDSAASRGVSSLCGLVGWTMTVEVGYIECVATVNDQGEPPNSAQMTSDAKNLLDALEQIMGSLLCRLSEVRHVNKFRINGWNPTGPDGGCAGGSISLTLSVDNCMVC